MKNTSETSTVSLGHAEDRTKEILEQIITLIRTEWEETKRILEAEEDHGLFLLRKGLSLVKGSKGKRLRPLLVLLSYRAAAKKEADQRLAELAALTELIHAASLLHDDVIDKAPLRRGVPVLHQEAGNRLSILAGDYLYSTVFHRLVEGFDPAVVQPLARAVRDMTLGEIIQSEKSKPAEGDEEDIAIAAYLSIIEKKTASLLSGCAVAGARLAGADSQSIAALGDYGFNMGLAFQITDDLLDWTGNTVQLGKESGGDYDAGVITLPLILLRMRLKASDPGWLAKKWPSFSFQSDAETKRELFNRMEQEGVFKETRVRAQKYIQAAHEALDRIERADIESITALKTLADFVVDRGH